MTSLITREKSSGPWEGYQTTSRSVGGGKKAHNEMMILWNYEQHPTMINTSWWRVGEWAQLDQLRIISLKDILWFDKHHQRLRVMLHLGGFFMSKNLIYPLKNGYDTWKMLSYECINWGQFATIIDNIWFDELLKKWE